MLDPLEHNHLPVLPNISSATVFHKYRSVFSFNVPETAITCKSWKKSPSDNIHQNLQNKKSILKI